MLNSLLVAMTDLLCEYGRWGAGLPSCHGSFEPSVPQELVEELDEKESQVSD